MFARSQLPNCPGFVAAKRPHTVADMRYAIPHTISTNTKQYCQYCH